MGKKVLFIATVDSHIELFHLPFLKMFKDKGYEVHVATETNKPIKYCDKKIKLPIKRSPFKIISNFKAIHELKKVLAEEKYEIVHCHTPVGGVVTRMAAKRARKNGTRVIYTAHGFHFYKGAPVHFWMMFYPIEWYLAKFTDTLITINNEDFERAKKRFGKRCRDIQYVPGVGVDPKKFEKKLTKKEKAELRESLGLSSEDKVLIFPAELSKRKNQMWLIKTLGPMFKTDNKLHLLLPGKDSLNGKCQALAKKLGVDKQVHFLGFRNDIPKLLQISDIAVSSSRQEGLPVNLMEAAFWGLPIVATDCRGNRDVCVMAHAITICKDNASLFRSNIKNNMMVGYINKDIFNLSCTNINPIMESIYFRSYPLISVIVPIYNGADYLRNCIDELLKQTYKNIEILLVNNHSTDSTKRIIIEYKKHNPNIVHLECNDHGVSFARNFGLEKSSGDYVCFVDCDDKVAEDYVERLYESINKYDVDLSIYPCHSKYISNLGDHVFFKDKKRQFRKFLHKSITKELLNSPCCKLYSKKIINNEKIRFNTDLSIAEDLLFNYEYLYYARSVFVGSEDIYKYNISINPNSLTTKFDYNKINQLLHANLIMRNSFFKKEAEAPCRFILVKNIYSVLKSFNTFMGDFESFNGYYLELKSKVKTVKKPSRKYFLMCMLAFIYNSGSPRIAFAVTKIMGRIR